MFWTHVFYFLFILFNFYNTSKLFKDSPLGEFGGPERTEIFGVGRGGSRSFATDASCQLNVFGHDGDSLCMNGTQVGILKEPH